MIYDEGFEIHIGNLKLFHFNHYEKPAGILKYLFNSRLKKIHNKLCTYFAWMGL